MPSLATARHTDAMLTHRQSVLAAASTSARCSPPRPGLKERFERIFDRFAMGITKNRIRAPARVVNAAHEGLAASKRSVAYSRPLRCACSVAGALHRTASHTGNGVVPSRAAQFPELPTQPGTMPLALITGTAAGTVRNRISALAASGSFAVALTAAVKTTKA